MNAKAATARRTLKTRSATTRATARIHRNGAASLTTYAVSAGLGIKAARTVASSLRDNAKRLQITGRTIRTHAGRRMRDCQVFTPAAVVLIATSYKPRKPAYRTARAHLLLAA